MTKPNENRSTAAYRQLFSWAVRSEAVAVNGNLQSGFRIGDWEVYPQENLLKGPAGTRVLEPKVMDVLVFVAARSGEVVSRQELLDSVWAGVVVGDETLSRAVSVLRRELDDNLKDPHYIKTISKRGYCFIADVLPLPRNSVDTDDSTAGADHGIDTQNGPSFRKYRFAIIGLIVAAAGLVLGQLVSDRTPQTVAEGDATLRNGRIMLAVLPLDNYSGDPEQEYFSDGLTEEIIAQLAGLRSDRLGVIARTSVMYYKGKNKRIDEIGRELNLDYVLEGSVRRDSNRVRITAQLIEVEDQTHLWARSFERDIQDILALQSDVAQRVTRSLALELLPKEQVRLERAHSVDHKAYEAYLRGRHHETRSELSRAADHYMHAIREDPEYALAYASLGHTYGMRGALGDIPIDEANRMAWKYNLLAAELDPSLAEVEMLFADLKFYVDWEWSEGEAGFRRAYEKNPNSESVVWHYALCLHVLGRYDEAVDVLQRALEVDPYSRQLNSALVEAYFNSRQYARAIQQLQQIAEFEPNDASIYSWLGSALLELGRDDEAVEALVKSRTRANDSADKLTVLRATYAEEGITGFWQKHVKQLAAAGKTFPLVRYAFIAARLGDRDQALTWLELVAQRRRVSPLDFAQVNVLAGENELALSWLETAYRERDVLMPWINVGRVWDPLRDDPRFQDLLRQMNLPQ